MNKKFNIPKQFLIKKYSKKKKLVSQIANEIGFRKAENFVKRR